MKPEGLWLCPQELTTQNLHWATHWFTHCNSMEQSHSGTADNLQLVNKFSTFYGILGNWVSRNISWANDGMWHKESLHINQNVHYMLCDT
jgi:hypothetical protein